MEATGEGKASAVSRALVNVIERDDPPSVLERIGELKGWRPFDV